jgi:hypothetical protein
MRLQGRVVDAFCLGATMIVKSLKRVASSDSDSENVDPLVLKTQIMKRKRSLEEDDLVKESSKVQKTAGTALTTAKTPLSNTKSPMPLCIGTNTWTPISCPSIKPAGRSPKSKPSKAFGRRSVGSATRVEPIGKHGVYRAPFTLAAALTQASVKSKTPARTRNSWCFNIHVDTEQEEMTNLMQHSTTTLDISDDEGKGRVDGRGKENIPPHELGILMPQPQQVTTDFADTRKNIMTEEPRSPLGELATSDYYGPGCNAMSFALVYDDDDEADAVSDKTALPPNLTFPSPAPLSTSRTLAASTISAIKEVPVLNSHPSIEGEKAIEPTEAEIEIWESGSAAEEATQASAEGMEVMNIFASA